MSATSLIEPPFQKRFVIAALLILALGALFWTGSRYPALDEKAMMSGAIQLEDPLSFEAIFPITEDMNTLTRIAASTLNWVNTNKKGMTFGVLFAAAFLTAAGYLRRRSFGGSHANALMGLAIGTPLGVCVNCAAPIAKGMYSAGMRAETTLAAMIASPTLNVVVLTMTFSLFPFYMAATKLGLSLFLILIGVPFICRFLPRAQVAPPAVVEMQGWSTAELGAPTSEGLFPALIGVAKSFLSNLWFIVRMTVPLMLLAGALGAIVATLLPTELILGLQFGLLALIVIALVGLFLPVPIAFDVVVAGTLLGLGLSQGFVMALIITLGSFSIYSYFIIAQAISQRAALLMSAAVLCLGVVAGVGAHFYHDWQSKRALELLLSEAPSQPFWAAAASEPSETVTITPHAPRSAPAETPFTRLEAATLGIDKPLEFGFADMWPPFWEGRSLSSGDIDRDGDHDLVIASTEAGLYLYANDGSGQFQRIKAALGPLAAMPVFNAVLVDIDNDGWLDLFVATYRDGNFLIPNQNGQLAFDQMTRVPNRDAAVLSIALSFADPDRDGDLDVALGNWAAGWYRRVPGEESRNRVLWNQNGVLDGGTYLDLPGIPGETLSILFTDMDGDGKSDLIVGNDFEVPDYFYLGDGSGGFEAITFDEGRIPHTTTTTMAVKTADLHNDGQAEVYLAQIAGRSSGVSETLKMQPLGRYCDVVEDPEASALCKFNMEIKGWYKSGNNFNPSYAGECQKLTGRYQAECKAMLVKDLAIQREDAGICRLIPQDQGRARSFCELHFLPSRTFTQDEADAAHPQILRSNVLLQPNGTGWDDQAEPQGLDVGGWSWDTKIADFNNDGFQDVYIVNGTWVPNEVSPSNLFFLNDGNGRFFEESGPFGLEDYLMTAAATAFDWDGDGDLDLVTHTVNGPIVAFRNNDQTGAAVTISLEDHQGNRDGIGAVVALTDAEGNKMQREVQMGGGFMSFDAPHLHFGLGQAGHVQDVQVRWADGSVSQFAGPFAAGHHLHIRRN